MVPLGHYFNPQRTMQDKIGLAAASYELAQSIPAILDYLGRPGSAMWAGVMEHEFGLQSTLLRYLNSRPDVVVYGERDADPALRLSTVSFTVAGWDSESLVRTVEVTSPFGFRWGMFYSNRLVEQVLGLSQPGVVRVSFVHYNTGDHSLVSCPANGKILANIAANVVQEVEAFIKALDAALSNKIPKATIQDGRAGLS